MQHPHRVMRADAADLRAGFMGHRARACVVGHLDDQRCGRADIDVYLRAVSEIDDLRHDATNDVAFRSGWLAGILQRDALRPDDECSLTRYCRGVDRGAEPGV